MLAFCCQVRGIRFKQRSRISRIGIVTVIGMAVEEETVGFGPVRPENQITIPIPDTDADRDTDQSPPFRGEGDQREPDFGIGIAIAIGRSR